MFPKVSFYIFLSFLSSYVFSDIKTCREANHTMYVALTAITDKHSLEGLEKFSYTFFLLPSFSSLNNFHLSFKAHFPINVNVDLSPDVLYVFQPIYHFCLNDLFNNRQKTILGNLGEHKTNSSILTGIWIEIDEILYNKEFQDEKPDMTKYLLMSNYQFSNTEVLIMKYLTTNPTTSYFQIVRARITEKDSNELVTNDGIEIGTPIIIFADSDKSNVILQEKQIYSGFIYVQTSLKTFLFDNIVNFVCLMSEGGVFMKECDYHKKLT